MTFILVIILSFVGQAAAVTTQEFNTLSACERAAKMVTNKDGVFLSAKAFCTEKGLEPAYTRIESEDK